MVQGDEKGGAGEGGGNIECWITRMRAGPGRRRSDWCKSHSPLFCPSFVRTASRQVGPVRVERAEPQSRYQSRPVKRGWMSATRLAFTWVGLGERTHVQTVSAVNGCMANITRVCPRDTRHSAAPWLIPMHSPRATLLSALKIGAYTYLGGGTHLNIVGVDCIIPLLPYGAAKKVGTDGETGVGGRILGIRLHAKSRRRASPSGDGRDRMLHSLFSSRPKRKSTPLGGYISTADKSVSYERTAASARSAPSAHALGPQCSCHALACTLRALS